jgi:hypothetical protein
MGREAEARTIAEIETALKLEDPKFVRRFRRTARRSTVEELAAFALLLVGSVLLVTGLGTGAAGLAIAGFSVLVSSAALPRAFRRGSRRTK